MAEDILIRDYHLITPPAVLADFLAMEQSRTWDQSPRWLDEPWHDDGAPSLAALAYATMDHQGWLRSLRAMVDADLPLQAPPVRHCDSLAAALLLQRDDDARRLAHQVQTIAPIDMPGVYGPLSRLLSNLVLDDVLGARLAAQELQEIAEGAEWDDTPAMFADAVGGAALAILDHDQKSLDMYCRGVDEMMKAYVSDCTVNWQAGQPDAMMVTDLVSLEMLTLLLAAGAAGLEAPRCAFFDLHWVLEPALA